MKKGKENIFILILSSSLLILALTVGYFYWQQKTAIQSERNNPKPPIIDYFACGDYCPGPVEKYKVKIYQGITDPNECKKIGGKPYSYTGWSKTDICLAPDGSSSSTKLQVCPEHWINNQAPCAYVKSPNECGNREYFIINGQRTELNEVDVDWVKQNCSTKREIAY